MTARFKPLAEQVIVMTGGASGVGLCTAQLAALLGATVVFISRSSDTLDSLVGAIESAGGRAMHLAVDPCDRDQVFAAAREACERFGHIDTWINNAGLSMLGRLDQVSEADSRRLFDVNFWSAVNGSLAALPHLVAAGGSLINVGSEAGEAAPAWQGLYASSKQALKSFTDALRQEIEDADAAPVSIALVEPAAAGGGRAPDPMLVAEAILRVASGSALAGAPPGRHAACGEPEREADVHRSH